MKTMKKALALILALAIVMSLGITAFADPYTPTDTDTPGDGVKGTPKIIVHNPSGSISIQGRTVTAYKLFDLSYDSGNGEKYAYTPVAALEENSFAYIPALAHQVQGMTPVTADNLEAYLQNKKGDESALQAFGQFMASWEHLNALPHAETTGAANGQPTEIDVSGPGLGLGYYLITVAPTAAAGGTVTPVTSVSLDTTNYNANVYVKAEAPTVDKDIKAPGDADFKEVSTTAQVGDVLEFRLESKIPNVNGYDKYIYQFQDTASEGLTIDPQSFTVKVGDTTWNFADNSQGKTTEKFYVNVDRQNIKLNLGTTDKADLVSFLAANDTIHVGDPIVVTYKATLNEKALTHNFEINSVKLQYSTDPAKDDGGTPEHTPESKVYVYDFNIDIVKFDADNANAPAEGNKLAGAKFVLQHANDGTYYKYDSSTNKVSFVGLQPSDKVSADAYAAKCTVLETNSDGVFTTPFQGLKAGPYTLYEIEAPQGYHKLAQPITVLIYVDSDGARKLTIVTYSIIDHNADDVTPVRHDVPVGEDVQNSVQLSHSINVGNKSGTELPSTGGIGTTIFYIVGAVMMAGALVLLITKKKMSVN